MDLTTTSYQLSRDGQQYGPYPGEQLVQMAQNQQVLPTDHLWCEGMAEWTPAQSFNQLAPIFAAAAPQAAVPAVATGNPRVASTKIARPGMAARKGPASRKAAPARRGAAHASAGVGGKKGGKFSTLGWSLGIFALGIVMFMVAGALVGATAPSFEEMASEDFVPTEPSPLAMGLMFGGMILYPIGLILYAIFTLIYLHRGWTLLQILPGVRSTPGKAIGFLFIPFFNYYWIFVCYHGWAQDYNLLKEQSQVQGAPEVPSGLFLAFCIGCFLAFGPLLHPFVMAKLCKAMNFLAETPDEELAVATA